MRTKTTIKTVIFSFLALIFGIIVGAGTYALAFTPASDQLYSFASGELSVHFLELGNQYAGDCIYIKANDNDILIDAGSRQQSATTITNYVNNYCTDGVLEYVIATHAHQDHIAAFPSTASRKGIFETYEVKNIIDFGECTKYVRSGASPSGVYNSYIQYRNKEINDYGANYAAVSDYNSSTFLSTIDNADSQTKTINLGSGITLKILKNKYYTQTTSNENNYSVCVLISQGTNNILLTGDLESEGEEYLASSESGNDLPKCTLFKAAHHGSYTGSTTNLLNVIKPEYVVITCVAGASEYTTDVNNIFPSKQALTNIFSYTDKCYVTSVCTNTDAEIHAKKYSSFASMNGDIIFSSNKNETKITCTNNNTPLKDTSWYKHIVDVWAQAS